MPDQQQDPAPGAEVADHERLVAGEDPRVADRGEAEQGVQRAGQAEHRGREQQPAGAALVVRVGGHGTSGIDGPIFAPRAVRPARAAARRGR
jgi:hypothetical protein